MRNKLLMRNSSINLLLQVTTIVCGLIVPRLILSTFGSETNGMISSITQFLSYIALLEAGVGGVVKAALYKPLANKDFEKLSAIVIATERFFKVISYIFLGYMFAIAAIYPLLINTTFSYLFTSSLVIIIGFSSFAQYYFGMTYQLLLQADQKIWLTSSVNIITLVVNTILTFVLIKIGCGIHVIKICSTCVYVFRPILYNIYVKRNYHLIKSVTPDNDAIKQRWDGLGHHIAYFIHSNTDIVIITLFLGNLEVSVYAVYYLVVSGIRSLVNAAVSAFEAFFGNLLVTGTEDEINKALGLYELVNYLMVTIMFSTAATMIIPFVTLYTSGIHDVNYIRPLFGYLLVFSEACYCVRNPYSALIFAAGKFKETRNGAFLEAFVNIAISLLLVKPLGIVGVAIGTTVAMLLRSIQYILFLSKNLIKRNIMTSISKILVFFATTILLIVISNVIRIEVRDITTWVIAGFEMFFVSLIVTLSIFGLFFHKDFKPLFGIIKRKLNHR